MAIGKLQLCRAHGGGARPRKKQYASPPNDDPIQNPLLQPSQIQKTPMQAGYADLGGEVQMQAGFADMTSV